MIFSFLLFKEKTQPQSHFRRNSLLALRVYRSFWHMDSSLITFTVFPFLLLSVFAFSISLYNWILKFRGYIQPLNAISYTGWACKDFKSEVPSIQKGLSINMTLLILMSGCGSQSAHEITFKSHVQAAHETKITYIFRIVTNTQDIYLQICKDPKIQKHMKCF